MGLDERAETEMLAALRSAIGPERKIRVDANQAWNVPQAVRLLTRWDADVGIDFAEAPVPIDPVENMRELRAKVPVALCANEGLGRVEDCLRVIRARCADVLCFSSYWVGSLRNFLTLSWAAHWEGQQVCKHTHGELGIAAAAGQHVLLAIPNAIDGAQQTAAIMADDILTRPLPIATGPKWGPIEQPGLGMDIDEASCSTTTNAIAATGSSCRIAGRPRHPEEISSRTVPRGAGPAVSWLLPAYAQRSPGHGGIQARLRFDGIAALHAGPLEAGRDPDGLLGPESFPPPVHAEGGRWEASAAAWRMRSGRAAGSDQESDIFRRSPLDLRVGIRRPAGPRSLRTGAP